MSYLIKKPLGFVRGHSLRSKEVSQLFMVGLLAFTVGYAGHYASNRATPMHSSSPQEVAANSAPMDQIINKSEVFTRETELGRNQNFASMLVAADVDDADAVKAMSALKATYDLGRIKAGQDVVLTFQRNGQQETLTGISFQPESIKQVNISRVAQGNGFVAEVKDLPLTHHRFAKMGVVRSSLSEAGKREGIPGSVMTSFIRIYSHTVDLQRDIQPGDRFQILYEQPTAPDGTAVGVAQIVYASLEVAGRVTTLYKVSFSDGTSDYFDYKGESLRRALLRTPVYASHVTSGFGMRMHPLLGFTKMHQGVDFGSPTGTPIFAAGNGVISEVGFKGGYGRVVSIRHNGVISTLYGHMSRFGRGMYPGARVRQGDVIGYVGSSGRATGPHLHFEVRVSGRQVNPLTVNLKDGRRLEGKMLAEFQAGQSRLKQEFASLWKQQYTNQAGEAVARVQEQNPAMIKVSAPAPASFIVHQTAGKTSKKKCGKQGC